MRKAMLVTALAVLLVPVGAFADSIEFTEVGGSWGLVGGTLVIQTGAFSIVSDNGTPLGVLSPVLLPFGSEVITSPTNGPGSLDITQSTISFGPNPVCSSDCFTGTFASSLWPNLTTGGNFNVDLVTGTIDSQLLADIVAAGGFGGVMPSSSLTGFFSGTLDASGINSNCPILDVNFSSCGAVGSLDISLTPAPVPEPGTMALFGTGLLSVAGFLRRKMIGS